MGGPMSIPGVAHPKAYISHLFLPDGASLAYQPCLPYRWTDSANVSDEHNQTALSEKQPSVCVDLCRHVKMYFEENCLKLRNKLRCFVE